MQNKHRVEELHPLTSLRFVAAMMIVLLHANLYFPWAWLALFPGTLVHGVSFFFVLSGFILTHVYTSKPFPGYAPFMRARFARLWPVHVFAICALVTFIRPDSITFDGPGIFDKWVQLAFNLTLTQSAMPYESYAFSWNSVSWSISTEMFFYLAFPLLLVNIRQTWFWKLAGAAAMVLAFLVAASLAHIPMAGPLNEVTVSSLLYTNPLVRGFEFCLGMGTWVVWDRYVKHLRLSVHAWTVLEALAVLLVYAWLQWGYKHVAIRLPGPSALGTWFGVAGSCWAFAILIAVMAGGRGAIGHVLRQPIFVFLGNISFSIYMLHQILFKFFVGWLPAGVTTPTMYFGALLFGAAGSYLMIERPAQRWIMQRIAHRATPDAATDPV